MARGGRRKGTPGRAYANRTDLQMAPDMSKNTAGSGGLVGTAPEPPAPVEGAPMFPSATPGDSPNLLADSMYPNEPVTAGIGDGTPAQMSQTEGQMFTPYLPMLIEAANRPMAAPSFVAFVRALRSAK